MEDSKNTGQDSVTSHFASPVTDPTLNVLSLVEAANRRQDDLREAERRYNDLRDTNSKEIAQLREAHQKDIADLREKHQLQMATKEEGRLDSIRQVDREDGNKRVADAQMAITTLANTTSTVKDNLQTQVQNTALTLETKQSGTQKDVNDRLAKLEQQQSEGKGKSGVRDPAIDDLIKAVGQLALKQDFGTGKSMGMRDMGGWIVAGILAVATIVGLGISIAVR